MTIDHILFPADFSPRAHAMIPLVEDLARRWNAKVSILHVLETQAYAGVAYEMLQMEEVRKVASRQLEAFGAADFQGLSVTRMLVEGRTPAVIVETSREQEASIIVMPTIGYTRFRMLLLGSVTASVLHDADVPVLTSAHVEDHPLEVPDYRTILCALDLEEGSAALLSAARAFAARLGARLVPVHAVPAVDPRFLTGPSDRAHRFLCDQARDKYAALGAPEQLLVMEAPGNALDGVVAAVRQEKAGLLIAGRGDAQGFLGRLRGNVHQLILKSPCPVLSI